MMEILLKLLFILKQKLRRQMLQKVNVLIVEMLKLIISFILLRLRLLIIRVSREKRDR